jgi:hypothetical protein
MAKAENRRFLMRITRTEQQQLARLSKFYGRTMTAQVKWLIRRAIQDEALTREIQKTEHTS